MREEWADPCPPFPPPPPPHSSVVCMVPLHAEAGLHGAELSQTVYSFANQMDHTVFVLFCLYTAASYIILIKFWFCGEAIIFSYFKVQ